MSLLHIGHSIGAINFPRLNFICAATVVTDGAEMMWPLEAYRAAGGGALGRGVGQFERLFDLEVRQAFDLKDAAEEEPVRYGRQNLPLSFPAATGSLLEYA